MDGSRLISFETHKDFCHYTLHRLELSLSQQKSTKIGIAHNRVGMGFTKYPFVSFKYLLLYFAELQENRP